MMIRFGYKASAEQFGPRELLDFSVLAEQSGLEIVAVSDHFRTIRATIYDKPAEPVPIYVAASGPLAAKLAGRAGDGFIATSGKKQELYEELLANLAEGAAAAGRDAATLPKFIEIKVSYDHDLDYARDACRWWAALSLTPEEKSGVEDAVEMERLADAAADRAH